MSGTDYTLTPNLGLYKPTVNADGDAWGGHWNQNADKLDTVAAGGPFLPLSGGTVTGSLNWTSTGSTTSRAAQGRTAEIINVRDFGAQGNGTTDDTAALNAAATAVPATGGTLYIPRGRYSTSGTLLIKSLTRLLGDGWGSVIAANTAWPTSTTLQLVFNQNYAATSITDHDIVVEDLAFDYTNMPAGLSGGTYGGIHAVSARMARNVQVRNCRFEGGTLGNAATAMVACDTTLVDGCVAYNMINCFYDHWWNPQNAKVVNCYARGIGAGILFNPDPTTGSSAGFAANNFLASGNTLIYTGPTIAGCQLEPLASGCTVSNVTVADNTFSNMQVVARGAVTGLVITGNTFLAMSNSPSIASWTANGGTPTGVVVTDNVIVNPSTTGPSPIAVQVDGAIVTGNQITGTAYGATPGIDTSSNVAVVVGNSVSNGTINAIASVVGTGDVTLRNGANFAWKDAGGSRVTWNVASDNHMIWFGTGASGGQRLIMDMYQRSDSSPMSWAVPMTFAGAVSGAGFTSLFASPPAIGATAAAAGSFTTLSASSTVSGTGFTNRFAAPGPIGSTTASTGAFTSITTTAGINCGTTQVTTVTDFSRHIALYPGVAGFTFTTDNSLNYNTNGAHFFYISGAAQGYINNTGALINGTITAGTMLQTSGGGGPTWTSGAAAPAATQPVGSLYSRQGGAVGATLYVSRGAGTWAPVAGV